MIPFTAVQKERIFSAFEAIDPMCAVQYNYTDTGFRYIGYVTLEGLVQVADVIASIQRENAAACPPHPSSCDAAPLSP